MPKLNLKILSVSVCLAICLAVFISTPFAVSALTKKEEKTEEEMLSLTVWQIDGFEGGKGSRASYLQKVGKKFSDKSRCYINVVSLTSDAARQNISLGKTPDLISYGAGMFGIESIIYGETPYHVWARGGYCLITLSDSANFSDASAKNTVINSGTDNLSGAAALFCDLQNAAVDKPTGAYVSLINGKYKYLLGTQRDIFRLETRKVAYKIKPITAFNDLYQNISITTADGKRASAAKRYIDFLLEESKDLTSLGLIGSQKQYSGGMGEIENSTYEYELKTPVSENMHNELKAAVLNSDIKKLKNLIK